MPNSIAIISVADLMIAFIPVILVLILLHYLRLNAKYSLYAIVRMLMQLLLTGYLLAFIFQADNLIMIGLIILIMILVSSWIALGNGIQSRGTLLPAAILSISLGGGAILLLILLGILDLNPWYSARYTIPLAGMVFANCMNSISLAAERIASELKHGENYTDARAAAYRAALIPVINALLAVGIVSLPGMMTGQILSGVSPLIAARYQIVVMCMIFSSSGLSTACFLKLSQSYYSKMQKAE